MRRTPGARMLGFTAEIQKAADQLESTYKSTLSPIDRN
jgi:hypothetical protein